MLVLKAAGGAHDGQTVRVKSRRPLVLGRLTLRAAQGDRTVSRQHAVLWCKSGRWLVADLASTRGTRLNGKRIRSPKPVKVGDRLTLGNLELVVHGIDKRARSSRRGSERGASARRALAQAGQAMTSGRASRELLAMPGEGQADRSGPADEPAEATPDAAVEPAGEAAPEQVDRGVAELAEAADEAPARVEAESDAEAEPHAAQGLEEAAVADGPEDLAQDPALSADPVMRNLALIFGKPRQ